MSHTKKVGSAGRFGARLGRSLRRKVSTVEQKQKAKYICPLCSYVKVKRIASGIWQCNKCNTKFASGAYSFE